MEPVRDIDQDGIEALLLAEDAVSAGQAREALLCSSSSSSLIRTCHLCCRFRPVIGCEQRIFDNVMLDAEPLQTVDGLHCPADKPARQSLTKRNGMTLSPP